MKTTLLSLATILSVMYASADSDSVSVDWSSPLRKLTSTPTLQVVVNPLISRSSPVHDGIFNSLRNLGERTLIRYVPWLPYPRYGVAELEPPSSTKLCAFRSSSYGQNLSFPALLDCSVNNGGTIASIDFVSYGQSSGYCGNLTMGTCTAPNALNVVKQACLGKPSCTVYSSDAFFGGPSGCGTATSLAVQVTCSNPATQHTYWDFSLIDPMMEDFMNSVGNYDNGTTTSSVVINFSTIPQWLYNTGVNNRVSYPDDPNTAVWNYEQGGADSLVDPTRKTVGEYYGRLLAWYTQGGFTDEYGVFYKSGHFYNITHWEVLNEVDFEHGNNAQTYTPTYDAIVNGIKTGAPQGTATMKFVGMALGGHNEFDFYTYFLNMSNHAAGIPPPDVISFHFYASASARDDPSTYTAFFDQADNFLAEVQQIIAIRNALNPTVKLDVDELGVILPNDNSDQWTTWNPGFPNVYWNAAGAMYAYLFTNLALLGVDYVGESQLVGYPAMPELNLAPQYPSVALLNWTDGSGTARYWVLKLLLDEFEQSDVMVQSNVYNSSSFTNPFCGEVLNLATLSIGCSDPTAVIDQIQFASYGTPSGTCGNYQVGTCNAANSTTIVESYCLNKNSCTVPATTPIFGDPCYGTVKNLVVQAHCSTGNGGQASTTLFAQGFISNANGAHKILIVNKDYVAHDVTVSGATGGTFTYIDESTGFGPANTITIPADTWTLQPYAVGVVTMP